MTANIRRGLNQRGFIHHFIPILAFVVLFGIIGAYFLLRARAAAPLYWFESSSNGHYCISNNGGAAQLRACSSSVSNATVTDTGGNQNYISIGGRCLWQSGNALAFSKACSTNSTDDLWQISGSQIQSLTAIYARQGYRCVSSKTVNGALSVQACGTSGYYQGWYKAQAPGSVSTGGGSGSTGFKVNLSGQAACYNNLYTTANAKTGSNCVAALQTMLNYMHSHYGGSTLTVDGYYGNNTATQVSKYQAFQKRTASYVSVDGQAGRQTWQFMCWSGRNNHFTTSRAYLYAECEHVAPPPGKKNP